MDIKMRHPNIGTFKRINHTLVDSLLSKKPKNRFGEEPFSLSSPRITARGNLFAGSCILPLPEFGDPPPSDFCSSGPSTEAVLYLIDSKREREMGIGRSWSLARHSPPPGLFFYLVQP